jgi:hypothetical protein
MTPRRHGGYDLAALLLAVILFLLCLPGWLRADPHRGLVEGANQCYKLGKRAVLLTDNTLECRP